MQVAGLNLSSFLQEAFGVHRGQWLWQHCPCKLLTAAVNKQLSGRNRNPGWKQEGYSRFQSPAKHIPTWANKIRAVFWHEKLGETFFFLLYWIRKGIKTENNHEHVERDKMILFLQLGLKSSALVICKQLLRRLYKVKYFPWSSFIFGYMKWNLLDILQRSSWCFQIMWHKINSTILI